MGQRHEPHFTHKSAVRRVDKRSNKWFKPLLRLINPPYGYGHVDPTTKHAMMGMIIRKYIMLTASSSFTRSWL